MKTLEQILKQEPVYLHNWKEKIDMIGSFEDLYMTAEEYRAEKATYPNVKSWLEKESKKGKLCVMLLPVSTSTVLFHDFIQPNAKEIRFVRGRIAFEGVNTFGVQVGKDSAPMHDSMIVVF